MISDATKRSIVRWIHLLFAIPIIGYVYSPFKELPNYAPVVRFVAMPVIVLTGFWMWKGYLLRRLVSKRSALLFAALCAGAVPGALADQEFYRGDSTYYAQPSPSKKQIPGMTSMSPGTYQRLGVGMLGDVVLRITPTEVQLSLHHDRETLTAAKRQSFLSVEIVTLSSGRGVQFFRPVEHRLHHLLVYAPGGGLQDLVGLVEKKG